MKEQYAEKSVLFSKTCESVPGMCLDQMIALLPVIIWSVYLSGWRSVAIISLSAFSGTLFCLLLQLVLKRKKDSNLFSKCVTGCYTGLVFALLLPAGVPLWLPLLGVFVSVFFIDGMLNRLSCLRISAPIAGYALLLTFFSSALDSNAFNSSASDLLATATPLGTVTSPDIITHNISNSTLFDMFFGYEAGAIGEVSVFLILLGCAYLLLRKSINISVTLSFLSAIFALTFLFPSNGFPSFEPNYALAHLFSGGTMLAAVYIIGKPGGSPVTGEGKILFGIGCGALTVLFRYLLHGEGIVYAILIMELLIAPIDRLTVRRRMPLPPKKATTGSGEAEK